MSRPTLPRLSSKKSSTAWLARQQRDPHVRSRLSHPLNFRSRSAFKLLELDQKYDFLCPRTEGDVRVVDLGAAPGGWSQVVAWRLGWLDAETENTREKEDSEEALEDKEDIIAEDSVEQFKPRQKSKKKGNRKLKPKRFSSSLDPGLDPIDEFLFPPETLTSSSTSSNGFSPRKGHGMIVSIDLLPMDPIPGVSTLQMDFLSPEADARITALLPPDSASQFSRSKSSKFSVLKRDKVKDGGEGGRGMNGKVDVILSDIAVNFTGNRVRDVEASLDICEAVFGFATRHLRKAGYAHEQNRGGALVLKHFAHPLTDEFRMEKLEPNFHSVRYVKPDSSRSESAEGYWLCFGWKPTTSSS